MKKSLSRAIAITAVCAAGLSGALVTNTSAVAGSASAHHASKTATQAGHRAAAVRTPFGYKADVFGTKLLVDGVEVKSLKDGYAQQRCTAAAGRETYKNSILSIPEDLTDLVHLSLTNNRSVTYKKGNTYGVKGISTVGDIAIGGDVPGLGKLPQIKIEGLQSVSDAFNKNGKFGHKESFGFKGISIDYDGTVVDGTPLAQLLDIVNQVAAPISQIVNQVIELLQSVAGNIIEIPGLGALGLGTTRGSAGKNQAISESYALKILINATGNDSVLQLGRARTRIARPVPAGVFRGTATGLDLFQDVLHLGNLGQRSIPCEGTNGKVVTQKTAHIGVLGGLVDLTGITYKFMGKQSKSGFAKGMIGTNIGTVSVPSLNLVIKGISSKVNLLKKANTKRVISKVDTGVLTVLLNGEEVALPEPGKSVKIGDNDWLVMRPLLKKNYFGAETSALSLKLGSMGGQIIDLGTAAGRIFPR